MENSRLFVRGLPPNLGEQEFRRHFAHTGPVTDARLMAHRRIGYVGYPTAEAASKALQYHNQTFLRTSKIQVEFAKSVAELRPDRGSQPAPAANGPEKGTRNGQKDASEHAKMDAGLNEFLDTMQPNRASIWETEVSTLHSDPKQQQQRQIPGDTNDDEEYAPLPKRRKTELRRSPTRGGEDRKLDSPHEVPSPQSDKAPKSDADWLKARTSQMLGLEEDVEDQSDEDDVETNIKGHRHSEPLDPAAPKAPSDASSQTDGDLHDPPLGKASGDSMDAAARTDERRLFVRNLSYHTTADELRQLFASFGQVDQVHVPRNGRTGESKGFAYVHFAEAGQASAAIAGTNAKPFQGRLLHVMPAAAKRDETFDDYAISNLPFKKQQQIRRKADAAASVFRWNTLFVNSDTVMASMAAKLGVSKSDILDPTSTSAAVKQAHAETSIIQETKNFFESNGVNLDSFGNRTFSDTVILAKNFSYGTSVDELRQLFQNYGNVKRLLMPPAGTMAIIELERPDQARKAFSALAYRKLGNSVLFLEKAPKSIFDGKLSVTKVSAEVLDPVSDELPGAADEANMASATLFVKNLNFDTTSAKLVETFSPLTGFLSALVKVKPDPKRPGQTLSMGFGFVEFRSQGDAQAALTAMNGYVLDGHSLAIKSSHKSLDAAEERRREDAAKKAAGRHTKIIIKNLPFEATRREVRELFSSYGKLRSIRVPKKFDNSTRGFAFADFVTVKEAQSAMEALAGAHLLGRRLNLEYASEEAVDPEKEIEAMSQKVGRQLEKVTARQLARSGGRKKFTMHQDDPDDVSFD